MAFTPVEIRHVRLGKTLVRGYDRDATDTLLSEIADSFETVWRERADLVERVERVEEDLVRYRELDTLLRTTLVSAERAAHEVKDLARREAATIVAEARQEARAILREAGSDRDALLSESRRIRALLQAALEAVTETGAAEPAEPVEPGEETAERPGWGEHQAA
jgi:cell division initiation protein